MIGNAVMRADAEAGRLWLRDHANPHTWHVVTPEGAIRCRPTRRLDALPRYTTTTRRPEGLDRVCRACTEESHDG